MPEAARAAARSSRPGSSAPKLPIAAEGWPFILTPLALALGLAGLGWGKTAVLPAGLAAFMAFFFRDPDRTPPGTPGAVLSPADGRVTEVRAGVDDPFVGPARRVVIFLSPLDVHVNRASISGRVAAVESSPGGFVPANRPEAEGNHSVRIALEGETGRLVMRQVVGVLARRIVCRLEPGDVVEAGERFGLIKFGSRMDVVMPEQARVTVQVGDRVRAGETVLAVLS
jgi:phosphatidylserine decarboxylase